MSKCRDGIIEWFFFHYGVYKEKNVWLLDGCTTHQHLEEGLMCNLVELMTQRYYAISALRDMDVIGSSSNATSPWGTAQKLTMGCLKWCTPMLPWGKSTGTKLSSDKNVAQVNINSQTYQVQRCTISSFPFVGIFSWISYFSSHYII